MGRRLDGSTSTLSFAGAIATATPLTAALWAISEGAGVARVLLQINDGSNSNRFQLNTSTPLVMTALTTAAGASSQAQTGATDAANALFHVAGVWASPTDRRVFLNGANKATNGTSRTPTGLNKTNIGSDAGGATVWNGPIFEAAIWLAALTDAEIALLGSKAGVISPLQIRRESLVWYAPLSGNGSVEVDLINGQNLVLSATKSYNNPVLPYVYARPATALQRLARSVDMPPPLNPYNPWPQLGPILAQ